MPIHNQIIGKISGFLRAAFRASGKQGPVMCRAFPFWGIERSNFTFSDVFSIIPAYGKREMRAGRNKDKTNGRELCMIEVKELRKRYGDVEAVKGVSFSVGKEQVLGFLGPNGAGKTTIMKILTGYHYPTEGAAFVDGLSVQEESTAVKARIGYLPEGVPLYGELTVDEYLGFVADARHIDKGERAARIAQALDACGLASMRGRRIETLSKGFRQRTGLAGAIVHDPPILILDEPTTGLDPNQIIEIRTLIKELGKRKTVILSTHILQEVEAVCNRVLILNEGKIAAQGTPEEIAVSMKGGVSWKLRLTPAVGEAGWSCGEMASAPPSGEGNAVAAVEAAIGEFAAENGVESLSVEAMPPPPEGGPTALSYHNGPTSPPRQVVEAAPPPPEGGPTALSYHNGLASPPRQVATLPPRQVVEVSLLARNAGVGVADEDSFAEALFDWAVARRYKILSMSRQRLTLEDIFVQLTHDVAHDDPRNKSGGKQ
ncbi:MAG: ATP-binding cassette domain-containing protein [Spirochaetaceae bacterium]|jgi:ABC-2 type transport system ATP-binding protein|nr:ATP-binding cassette domain-containing protein [Spirochaetaceae bacterium]